MGNDSSHNNGEHGGGHFLLACRVQASSGVPWSYPTVNCLELVIETWNDFCEAMRRGQSG